MESTVALQWAYPVKRQSAYQTAQVAADLTQSHPFEGADFGEHTPNMSDNAPLFGKGHEFATNLYLLSWDTRFRRTAFLTSKLAGWAFAFHCGKVTTTPLGGSPAAYQHVYEYQDHTGTGYYGSGRQLPVFTIVEKATSGLVRQFPSMLISAVELSGNMNDFCRIALDLIGSGMMTRLPASDAAATSATNTIGSGTNGTVTTTVTATGTAGNAFTMEVNFGVGNNQPLGAALVGTAITVTLATDGSGNPNAAANTAALVAAAIDALASVTSVASGTGATAISAESGPTNFTGGAAAVTGYDFPTGAAGEEGVRLRNTAMLFELGETGDLQDTSCDIRSWRFRSEYSLAEDDGYCPGSGYFVDGDPDSGQIRNRLEFLRRAVLLEFTVRASADNTYFSWLEGQTELAALITLTGTNISGANDNQVIIDVPRLRFRTVPIGSDGDIVTYSVTTVVMYDDTMANPFEITVINETPAYLVAST